MKLKDGEHYWLNAPALSEQNPIIIGVYYDKLFNTPEWYIEGRFINAGPGIDVISHIRKPKNK